MKEFKIINQEDQEWNSNLISIDYIYAKNMDSAINKVIKEFLTKEQRKNIKGLEHWDSKTVSIVYDIKHFDKDTYQEIEDNKPFNEDTMFYTNYELVIMEN